MPTEFEIMQSATADGAITDEASKARVWGLIKAFPNKPWTELKDIEAAYQAKRREVLNHYPSAVGDARADKREKLKNKFGAIVSAAQAEKEIQTFELNYYQLKRLNDEGALGSVGAQALQQLLTAKIQTSGVLGDIIGRLGIGSYEALSDPTLMDKFRAELVKEGITEWGMQGEVLKGIGLVYDTQAKSYTTAQSIVTAQIETHGVLALKKVKELADRFLIDENGVIVRTWFDVANNLEYQRAINAPDFPEAARKIIVQQSKDLAELRLIYRRTSAELDQASLRGLQGQIGARPAAEIDELKKFYSAFEGASPITHTLYALSQKPNYDLELGKLSGEVRKLVVETAQAQAQQKLLVPETESKVSQALTAQMKADFERLTPGQVKQLEGLIKNFMKPDEHGNPTLTYLQATQDPKTGKAFLAAVQNLPPIMQSVLSNLTKDQATLTTVGAQIRSQLAQYEADYFQYKTLIQPQLDKIKQGRTGNKEARFGVQDLIDAAKTPNGLNDLANELTSEDGVTPLSMKVRTAVMDDWRKQIQDPANAAKAEWEAIINSIKVAAIKGEMGRGVDAATAMANVNIQVTDALMGGNSFLGNGGRGRLKIPSLDHITQSINDARTGGQAIKTGGAPTPKPLGNEVPL